MNQHFAYGIQQPLPAGARAFRVERTKDGVTLTDDLFLATFGFFKLATQLTNITGAHYPELPLVDRVRCARVTC